MQVSETYAHIMKIICQVYSGQSYRYVSVNFSADYREKEQKMD